MKQKKANLEYSISELEGCCGIQIALDFYFNEYRNDYDEPYVPLKTLKENFKRELKVNRAGMLIATTALEDRGRNVYGTPEEHEIERKLKGSGWKRTYTCINPNTDNKITLWVFT